MRQVLKTYSWKYTFLLKKAIRVGDDKVTRQLRLPLIIYSKYRCRLYWYKRDIVQTRIE